MLYRVSGESTKVDPETGKRVSTGKRVTVMRSHTKSAIYEDMITAQRAMLALGSNMYYVNLQVEATGVQWTRVG